MNSAYTTDQNNYASHSTADQVTKSNWIASSAYVHTSYQSTTNAALKFHSVPTQNSTEYCLKKAVYS